MRQIMIQTARPYTVCVGEALLARAGQMIKESLPFTHFAVVTDQNVAPLYQKILSDSLCAAGYPAPPVLVLPAGEESKSLQTAEKIYHFLAESGLKKDGALVSLGGGVIGDVTGFAASTYLRGVPFIGIPTTLLAQVDAAVGGKTAVNLSFGKNLVGSFWQPSLVLADTATLKTLPDDDIACGMAEVIKYAFIADPDLLPLLEGPAVDYETVVARCITVKKEYVEADERDEGRRMLLNFGHTVGHALEKYENYQKSHGWCVAAGMGAVINAQRADGTLDKETRSLFGRVCTSFSLPAGTDVDFAKLLSYMQKDKKASSGTITAVLLKSTGQAYLQSFTPADFLAFLQRGRGV